MRAYSSYVATGMGSGTFARAERASSYGTPLMELISSVSLCEFFWPRSQKKRGWKNARSHQTKLSFITTEKQRRGAVLMITLTLVQYSA